LEIFGKIKKNLKDKYPKEYDKFFKNLEIDEIESSSENIILYTQNVFLKKTIERKFLDDIKILFDKYLQTSPNIEIKVKNKTIKKSNNSIKKEEFSIETKSKLLDEYSFDNFVVGESNQFAYISAKNIAKNPGELYNPFLIYGRTGIGKTHLIQAIGNFLKDSLKVIYVTSEEFTNTFLKSMRENNLSKFHEIYRNCDVLLIDDFQFIAGKDKTQEEFFHTFNELYQNKKQICLTSDKHPSLIPDLAERLKDRFEKGLILDIQPPEIETKIKIIEIQVKKHHLNLTKDAIEYLATNVESIRQIEGAILKISAISKISHINLVNKEVLKDIIKSKKHNSDITIEDIVNTIAKEFNVKPSEIVSKKRNRNIVLARRIAILLSKELTKENSTKIAKYFNFADHSGVVNSIKKLNKILEEKIDLKLKIEAVKNKIENKNVNNL